ncbi:MULTISPECIES: peptidoglycan DD-metalloendopeptidase family protein [Chromohalobacter]|uniref:peptidoglycan DD-metalloendopeptidase family protein n=1 Tax=Chromohalobacter TaxID=42054 RepID=UPI0015C4998F|nr:MULTISPECIES: peptidoglycan DD-metalloendopeptidase family protein [Chromohalobacter]MBZ5875457.1 peptidoglycan DD-metalloendopeptidase family protein [Chromohalobacter salexigens]MDO0944561.1 peptidoglycan DD-metalloendopeptidase family protein [Chromohalobacter salexigens]NQY44859.1 peptidoglycan DD-metalloendopeptidase family protein [Chromohalobacter sp.]NWO55097.1 peptidase M23 [Chromohalobacter salexigens]
MLRILHSLPRTHKLLLLPVATMVTVLGAHQIVTVVGDDSGNATSPKVATSSDSTASTLGGEALDTLATVTTRNIPLSDLKAQEIVDVSLIDKAHAKDNALPEAQAFETRDTHAHIANAAMHVAIQLPKLASESDYDSEELGGTSYEDFSIDPMELHDEDGTPNLEREIAAQQEFVPEWETYTVQKGDTFAQMAERTLGLGYSDVMHILDSVPDKNTLTRWRVGRSFDYQLDEQGDLLALRVMKNAREGYLIERDSSHDDFDVSNITKATEATQRLFAGTVSGSFTLSAESTGLSGAEVAQLTNLLSKKLDFRRNTRAGDHFQVLVESDMLEGESVDSRILAAQYQGERMDLTVVRNSADDRFYTPDGQSLDPAFNRYPFEGHYRISSPFNLRRHHPITGRISPHRGTDFAMRTGTPVDAPAAGRVIKSAYQAGGAGNYLVIRHDNGYKTRYMHLSKRLVSEGDRVEMGQKIALSGNTGGSTGPHLHYEVMVNNRAVDAMRVKLPENQSLEGKALAAFQKQSKPLLAKLESDADAPAIASVRLDEDSGDEG